MLYPITGTGLALRRLLRTLGEKALMVSVVLAPVIGFTWLGSCASRPIESDQKPGSGTVTRAEVRHVWLPETSINAARSRPISSGLQPHEDPQNSRECGEPTNLWYALTVRLLQRNGETTDITFIRHPFGDSKHFQEFLEILALAAGKPPAGSEVDYSRAQVHTLSADQSEREPGEVVSELLSEQFPPTGMQSPKMTQQPAHLGFQ